MDELKKVNKAINSLWQIFKEFSQINKKHLDASEWDAWTAKTREVWEESGRMELVMDLICVFADDMERRYK